MKYARNFGFGFVSALFLYGIFYTAPVFAAVTYPSPAPISCSDWFSENGTTCLSGVFTPGGSPFGTAALNTGVWNPVNAGSQTFYLTYTVDSVTPLQWCIASSGSGDCNYFSGSLSYVDEPFTVSAGFANDGSAQLEIQDSSSFLGTEVSNICISDTLGICGVPPPPPLVWYSPDTTFSTTTQYVDNPTQDYFNGVILFFVVMVFTIWFFRPRI